ncbi:MAG TPA: DoxX-like family protein [Burkholderiaceae bacterium]|jgi:hypothetical protein
MNLDLLRKSLIATWLLTAVFSVIEWHGQSHAMLEAAGMGSPFWRDAWILLGAAFDAVVGLALWLRPGRLSYRVALIGMVAMTVIATVLLPSLWLNPLGPLLKNLPIAAALLTLDRALTRTPTTS